MEITRADRVRMERAHVHAWPALQTERIDGWLWRSSGGGSQRANSVSAIDFTGNDPEAAIDTIEARYAAVGEPARFQTFDETSPPELVTLLGRQGYLQADPTVTMFRRNDPVRPPDDVDQQITPWRHWNEVYFGAITESRRGVNARILASIPAPRAFFGYHNISTALCAVSFDCAVVECVATRNEARRQGGARIILNALLAWAAQQQANLVGLQVVADNTPAVRLYESLGFFAGATNRFWVRPTS
jgi:GNAT superfamily N-acetyltransferase